MSTNQKELTNFESEEIVEQIVKALKCEVEQKIFNTLTKCHAYKDSSKKCEKCKIANTSYKWCELCQIMTNFPNCNSSNEKICDFVQEMQLIDEGDDIGFTVF